MAKYSIVVPAYNEEQSLRLFYDTVTPVFESLHEEYEIIFVNDGSTDKTQEILADLTATDKRIKACRFSRNFGQQSAILCGLEKSTGDAVIVMDADLQDSPETALLMIEKWKEGYEIVHGKRSKREGESAFKKRTADFFYAITRRITGLDIPSNVGDFKLYDRKVVEVLVGMSERDGLLRVQTAWLGFRQTCVEFNRPKRVAGETHYTLRKMLRLAKSGIYPNTEIGLKAPFIIGGLLFFASLVCMLTFLALSAFGVFYGGLTAWLFPALGLFTSIILFCQGLANVHTGMIYREVQNRPRYIVCEELNIEKREK